MKSNSSRCHEQKVGVLNRQQKLRTGSEQIEILTTWACIFFFSFMLSVTQVMQSERYISDSKENYVMYFQLFSIFFRTPPFRFSICAKENKEERYCDVIQ